VGAALGETPPAIPRHVRFVLRLKTHAGGCRSSGDRRVDEQLPDAGTSEVRGDPDDEQHVVRGVGGESSAGEVGVVEQPHSTGSDSRGERQEAHGIDEPTEHPVDGRSRGIVDERGTDDPRVELGDEYPAVRASRPRRRREHRTPGGHGIRLTLHDGSHERIVLEGVCEQLRDGREFVAPRRTHDGRHAERS
jgi:hypothetical protein